MLRIIAFGSLIFCLSTNFAASQDFGQRLYSQYRCQFVLPLYDQGKRSMNRVGAIIQDATRIGASNNTIDLGPARYCVKSDEELPAGERAVNYDYRRAIEGGVSLKADLTNFKLTGLQAEYINEIVINMKNVKVTDLPDNKLDQYVQYARQQRSCQAYRRPELVAGNCLGELDLKFYFKADLTIANIEAVINKLTLNVGGTVKIEEGQDADPRDPSRQRKYVRVYTQDGTPAVFGLRMRSAWEGHR